MNNIERAVRKHYDNMYAAMVRLELSLNGMQIDCNRMLKQAAELEHLYKSFNALDDDPTTKDELHRLISKFYDEPTELSPFSVSSKAEKLVRKALGYIPSCNRRVTVPVKCGFFSRLFGVCGD